MILLGHDETVADWVGNINGKPFHAPFTAIGVLNGEGMLTGGYVFTGFNGDGVEVSMAGRGCISRSACAAMLSYVFEQLGCSRLQMHTRRSNKTLRKLAPRLGFHHEGVARKFYGKEDGLLFSLTTDDLSAFRAKWRI
jgi:RimJ/RimL family protein N-acetyltransferase